MTRSPISNFRLVCIWVEEAQMWRPMAGGPIPERKAKDTSDDYLKRNQDGRTCVIEIKGGADKVKLYAGRVSTYQANEDT